MVKQRGRSVDIADLEIALGTEFLKIPIFLSPRCQSLGVVVVVTGNKIDNSINSRIAFEFGVFIQLLQLSGCHFVFNESSQQQ